MKTPQELLQIIRRARNAYYREGSGARTAAHMLDIFCEAESPHDQYAEMLAALKIISFTCDDPKIRKIADQAIQTVQKPNAELTHPESKP